MKPYEPDFRKRKKEIARNKTVEKLVRKKNLEIQMRVNEYNWRKKTINQVGLMVVVTREIVSQK